MNNITQRRIYFLNGEELDISNKLRHPESINNEDSPREYTLADIQVCAATLVNRFGPEICIVNKETGEQLTQHDHSHNTYRSTSPSSGQLIDLESSHDLCIMALPEQPRTRQFWMKTLQMHWGVCDKIGIQRAIDIMKEEDQKNIDDGMKPGIPFLDQCLLETSYLGYSGLVKALIDAQAHTECYDALGNDPLTSASAGGFNDIVKLLLKHGSSVEHNNMSGETALLLSSWNGHDDVVQCLLENKADTDHRNNRGETSLWLASVHDKVDVVRLLLAHNATIDTTDNLGSTALCSAVEYHNENDSLDTIECLIEAGGKSLLEQRTRTGYTPLHIASIHGQNKALQLIIDSKSDIEATDQTNKNTALGIATILGHLPIVQRLLRNNANPRHINNYSDSILQLAKKSDNLHLTGYIHRAILRWTKISDKSIDDLPGIHSFDTTASIFFDIDDENH